MKAVFEDYNISHEGRDIEFINHDDGLNGEAGKTLTKRLVEEDNIFSLVGHFGTNTVNATVDYIQDKGIPMVYGVTNVNSLFLEKKEKGNPLLAVQPIYHTEGRVLVARVLHESLFGPAKNAKLPTNAKIVALYSEDDPGLSILQGIEAEVQSANIFSRFSKIPFKNDTATQAVTTALSQNPGDILISSIQASATALIRALKDANSTVPCFSSNGNGSTVVTPALTIVSGNGSLLAHMFMLLYHLKFMLTLGWWISNKLVLQLQLLNK
jgi:ABC-type branched-subunit amino acid transport system substrate-binding protein